MDSICDRQLFAWELAPNRTWDVAGIVARIGNFGFAVCLLSFNFFSRLADWKKA